MGIKVDAVDDPEIPQHRENLTLDFPYTVRGETFTIREKVGMQPGMSAI
jgi:hypothetical protein